MQNQEWNNFITVVCRKPRLTEPLNMCGTFIHIGWRTQVPNFCKYWETTCDYTMYHKMCAKVTVRSRVTELRELLIRLPFATIRTLHVWLTHWNSFLTSTSISNTLRATLQCLIFLIRWRWFEQSLVSPKINYVVTLSFFRMYK